MPAVDEGEARAILGSDFLGAQEVSAVFRIAPPPERPKVPFSAEELRVARSLGEMLVLRAAALADGTPLTIMQMIQEYPDFFEQKSLRQMGYLLKDEWGIALEPLAASETCVPGWALVHKAVLDDSRNLPFDEQDPALRRYAAAAGVEPDSVQRRSAVETVYDTVLYFRARQVRLLGNTWDWSASRTRDGGYLNVGGFGSEGMQIFAYSKAIRHGGLGVCPARLHSF